MSQEIVHAPASAPVRFKPKAKHLAYLEAVLFVLGDGGRLTNKAIGAAMKPPQAEDAVRKFRTRNPEVDEWVDEQCRIEVEGSRGRVMMRARELALKGSIDHMNYLAKVGGWFAQPDAGDGPGGAATTFNVNLLIPRPPAL